MARTKTPFDPYRVPKRPTGKNGKPLTPQLPEGIRYPLSPLGRQPSGIGKHGNPTSKRGKKGKKLR